MSNASRGMPQGRLDIGYDGRTYEELPRTPSGARRRLAVGALVLW
ncbi:hypothetical protein [Streptomyces sp. NPDC020917]